MTDHLLRNLAPITAAAWQAIENDVRPRLEAQLAVRKLVDFEGPLGWNHSATNLGRVHPIETPSSEIKVSRRVVLALVEVRADFALSRAALDDVERGARDIDLSALDRAAHHVALAENQAVFH